MRKLEKMVATLNESFRDDLTAAMANEVGVEVQHHWHLIEERLITTRVDDKDFTSEQMFFLKGYSAGFVRAMQLVSDEDMR